MSYVVCATWTAKPDEVDNVGAALAVLAEATRNEPGNLVYQVHRDPDDERVFFLYEQYVDPAGYEAHGASAHFQRAFEDAVPRLVSRERAFYETWDV